ncbi:S8 family serine peptidase [Kitasatospora sp. NPDC094015]|uniref:S8 family serine peptidase n=1 Tax=Kitasatospora sp. NPDC094015 TaxID=3155205 RepID=UPI003317339C
MTLTRTMRVLGATALTGTLLLTAAPTASADQVRDAQWTAKYLEIEKSWTVSKGDGVIVAVIDSGVDATHADLTGQVLPGFDPGGKGRDQHPTDPHGTGMASTIAGHGHGNGAGVIGLAPGAKILPIYLNDADNGDALPQGIRWAVEHQAKVINVSAGSTAKAGRNAALTDAIAFAAKNDVLIVASAGNDGVSGVHNPGNEPGVVAVGAVDKNGTVWRKSNYGPEVLLSAPGVEMVSAGACEGSQYCLADGTSDAAASVSGAAALVRAKFPQLTAGQVANRLVKSAQAPSAAQGGKLPDAHYGYGILRPYAALTQDIPAGSPQGPLAGAAGGAASGAPSAAGTPAPGASLPQAPAPLPAKKSDSGFPALLALAGGALVLVLLIVVIVAVTKKSRRGRPQAPGLPPQAPGGYGGPAWSPQQPYANQAPPPGFPPQQPPQNPYQQPYQNPYNQGGGQ